MDCKTWEDGFAIPAGDQTKSWLLIQGGYILDPSVTSKSITMLRLSGSLHLLKDYTNFYVRYVHAWNLKHRCKWMTPNHYMKNGCFSIAIYFKTGYLGLRFPPAIGIHTNLGNYRSQKSFRRWWIRGELFCEICLLGSGLIANNLARWIEILHK